MLVHTLPQLAVFVILALGTFLGLTLGAFLLINKSAKTTANRYLGLLILVIVTYFIPPVINRAGLADTMPHVLGIMKIAPFLLGPLAYLYVRACTQKGFELRPILYLHFIPFLIDIFHHLPFFMKTGAEKIETAQIFRETGDILEHPLWLAAKAVSMTIYFFLSARLILQYRKHLTNTVSNVDAYFHRWLLVFIFTLTIPFLGLIGYAITKFNGTGIFGVAVTLFPFILAIYFATLIKPELFHAFPHQMPIPESAEAEKQRYERSSLKDTKKQKYLEKLINYVVTEKPYQASELTLAQLAEQVDIAPHYLSQVINEKLNINFLDFINGYRVKAAQELLMDSKLNHYTILSIAYDAGFNSKSTFYAAFKKITGMTPSAYRKQKKAA